MHIPICNSIIFTKFVHNFLTQFGCYDLLYFGFIEEPFR